MVRKGEVLSGHKPHGYFTIYAFTAILSTAIKNVVNSMTIFWTTLQRVLWISISREGVVADIRCVAITTRLKEK